MLNQWNEGPKFVVTLSLIVAVWSALFLIIGGFSEHSLNQMLTITLRFSFLYFIVAFAASSIVFFYKSKFSRWLIRNRRYIGIAFGIAFSMHFLGIGMKAWLYPDPFVDGLHYHRVLRGGTMLGTVLLLTMTSSDYVVRRVSPILWKSVHVMGSFYIFYRFWQNYLGFAEYNSIYYIAVVILAIAALLKLSKYIVEQSKSVRLYSKTEI